MCAPSMGVSLWGESPLWEYRPGLEKRAGQPRVEGKGVAARRGLEEAVDKRCEATDRNHIKEAQDARRASTRWRSPMVQRLG